MNLFLKRIFDFSISFLAIIVLLPLMLVIALIVKFTSRGPVLFKQVRVGKELKEFKILKFRTMYVDQKNIKRQITTENDPRITKVGAFLRKTKLDELPQLFNVLVGDMSFVGPRPEVPKYVAYYTNEQKRVLSVRPGITDYASIEFRNESEMLKGDNPEKLYIEEVLPKKLELSLRYIDEMSLWNDIKVIFKTLKVVLFE